MKIQNRSKLILEEIETPEKAEIHFQDPEELDNENEKKQVVVHDDDANHIHNDIPEHEEDNIPNAQPPVIMGKDDKFTVNDNPTPVDIINTVKKEPSTVAVVQHGSDYFIDYNDMKHYMDASGKHEYTDAVDSIITANNNPDMNMSNMRIIMSLADYNNLTSNEVENMEESAVTFEAY